MQNVSKEYRESMKSPLRERAYIMLSFGIVNKEAQNNATVLKKGLAPYSSPDLIFKKSANLLDFATLEQDWLKVDGSMFFQSDGTSYGDLKTGVVSENTVDENGAELTVNLNVPAVDIKGLTIDFGANYPVDFDILTDTEQVLEVRGNTQSEFKTEEVFNGITQIKLLVKSMKKPNQRLRIYSMLMGYGLVFTNDDVIDSSMNTYVSPICEDLPQIDFEVKLKNNDRYFNVDNPKSAIHFIETGQEMEISYGYQLPDSDKIEWVKEQKLLCSEWDSDDTTATIRCQDILRNLDGEYKNAKKYVSGLRLSNLAREVFEDLKIKSYYLDPILDDVRFSGILPEINNKEMLQIIANACRCTLSQSRDGKIAIISNIRPEFSAKGSPQEYYSKAENITNDIVKDEYANFSTDYIKVDGSMYFPPRLNDIISGSEKLLNTGYVSLYSSDYKGGFPLSLYKPKVTLTMKTVTIASSIDFVFGDACPKEINIEFSLNGETEYENFIINKTNTTVNFDTKEFDRVVINIKSTIKPNSRAVINNIGFNGSTDFTIEKNDMVSVPLAIKEEMVKEISVIAHEVTIGRYETILETEVEAKEGQTETFEFEKPVWSYMLSLTSKVNAEIVSSNEYSITIKYTATKTFDLKIFGKVIYVTDKKVVKSLNERGSIVEWNNPLINSQFNAQKVADWLANYYKNNIEYEYDTRGNPELDPLDIVYQENDFVKDMQVQIYDYTLNFNQAFSGKITARRIGG